MTYRGRVKNGVVELDERATLPEGTEVDVTPVQPAHTPGEEERRIPTLAERLAPLIGCLEGLPPDLAENHDHYLYGAPKRECPPPSR